MKAYRVWEGSKGQKGLRKGGRKVTFKGEELGYWSDGHPTTDRRNRHSSYSVVCVGH